MYHLIPRKQLYVSEFWNWQPIDESKQGLLPECSTDVAQMVVEKLCIPVSHNWKEKEDTKKDVQLDDDTDSEKEDQDSIEQVCLQSPHICILTVSRYFGHL